MPTRRTASSANDRSLSEAEKSVAAALGEQRCAKRGRQGSASGRRNTWTAGRWASRMPSSRCRWTTRCRRTASSSTRVLRNSHELHGRQVAAGARSAARRASRRPPRDRDGPAAEARTEARRIHVCEGYGDTERADGIGRAAEKPVDPKHGKGQSLFPAPQRLGAFIGGFAPGTSAFNFESRIGDPDSRGFDDRAADALHDQRQGSDRPDQGRPVLRQGTAGTELRLGTLINGQLKIPAGEKRTIPYPLT